MCITKTRIRIENLHSKEDFPFAPLEGVGPNLSGWGVVETSLLLPETLCVMAGPSACLRHSAFMAHARGFTDRFYMICLSELDMTLGKHTAIVHDAVRHILNQRPAKALFLLVGCPDYVLGTDYTGVIQDLEKETGTRIVLGAMAPITIGLKDSPFTSAYTSFFEFLDKKPRDPDPTVLNILGTFVPLSQTGELYHILHQAEVKKILQIPSCSSLEEFSQMASAGSSIVLHPLANGLAAKMSRQRGIPSAFVPTAYGLKTIKRNYEKIEDLLGKNLDWEPWAQKTEKEIVQGIKELKGKKLAVGCSVNGSPFELAKGLVELGLDVDTIFARGNIKEYEWQDIKELGRIKPDIQVYNISHPYLGENMDFCEHVEIALGVDAGIYCINAANAPLSRYQEQKYGFENTKWMLEQIHQALRHPISNREWIYKHNFLI